MRTVLLLALLLVVAAPLAALEPVVVLEGTLAARGPVELSFVADETTLARASLDVTARGVSGLSGDDIMAYVGPQLASQARLYRAAQAARGVAPRDMKPLYVLLDPTGTWAFAQSGAQFSYVRSGKKVGPLTAPILILGKDTRYAATGGRPVEADPERGARLRALVSSWYASVAGGDSLEAELKRYTLTFEDGTKLNLGESCSRVSAKSYLGYLKHVAVSGLNGRKLDGEALWASASFQAEATAILAEAEREAARHQIAETVSHELGHLIHFAAIGSSNVSLGGPKPHLEGTSHALTTLSDETFAFVEGWAQANSMVAVGSPLGGAKANRRDYEDTVKVVRSRINRAYATAVARALSSSGRLPAGTALTVPPYDSDRNAFVTGLLETATKVHGMPDAEFDAALTRAKSDPEVAHLLTIEPWVESLQSSKGELKGRYDFLRSEYAVANALASLRRELGPEAALQVMAVLAPGPDGKVPSTFAELVEAFVHRHPEHRLAVYRILATATEGILVTDEQVAFLERQGGALEIDIDRNGVVPGGASADAVRRYRDLFPAEPPPVAGVADPLKYDGPTTGGLLAAAATTTLAARSAPEGPLTALSVDEGSLTEARTGPTPSPRRDETVPAFDELLRQ